MKVDLSNPTPYLGVLAHLPADFRPFARDEKRVLAWAALDTDAGQSGERELSAFPTKKLTSESHFDLVWQGNYALFEGPLEEILDGFSWS
ncbi:MAG TPA: hypothetical protein VN776_15530 [Terracidiphilus sp.]|nr:hypothetical protein [Terracidiphilus sp.]